MNCPKCNKPMARNGVDRGGKQKWICKACGVNRNADTVIEIPVDIKQMGISEAQLRAKHDLRFIVESKCTELKKGVFMTQAEFVQSCKINPSAGYRGVIEHPEYDKFHGRASGTIYWSHPDSIKKLKDEGVLI